MKGVLIGGTRTGVGKTTITLALLKGLSKAGYQVQSFKLGPGFVDVKLHERLTGRPCYNLDAFLMGETGVKRDLAKAKADFVIIEGASGVFTGASSTARIADIIGAPMILTVDASASSESVAATVLGFMQYASHTPHELRIVGVVATRVGSDKHIEDIRRLSRESGFRLWVSFEGTSGSAAVIQASPVDENPQLQMLVSLRSAKILTLHLLWAPEQSLSFLPPCLVPSAGHT